jgi:hypothetical protein
MNQCANFLHLRSNSELRQRPSDGQRGVSKMTRETAARQPQRADPSVDAKPFASSVEKFAAAETSREKVPCGTEHAAPGAHDASAVDPPTRTAHVFATPEDFAEILRQKDRWARPPSVQSLCDSVIVRLPRPNLATALWGSFSLSTSASHECDDLESSGSVIGTAWLTKVPLRHQMSSANSPPHRFEDRDALSASSDGGGDSVAELLISADRVPA